MVLNMIDFQKCFLWFWKICLFSNRKNTLSTTWCFFIMLFKCSNYLLAHLSKLSVVLKHPVTILDISVSSCNFVNFFFTLFIFNLCCYILKRCYVLLTDLNFINIQWCSLSHVIKIVLSKGQHCDTMILVRTIWNCQFCRSNCNFALQSNSVGSFVDIVCLCMVKCVSFKQNEAWLKKNVVWWSMPVLMSLSKLSILGFTSIILFCTSYLSQNVWFFFSFHAFFFPLLLSSLFPLTTLECKYSVIIFLVITLIF